MNRMRLVTILGISASALILTSAPALAGVINVTEDFESTSGSTVPANWSLIQTAAGTYSTTNGHNGSGGSSGNGGRLDGGSGPNTTPGTYIINNSPLKSLDLQQDITVSFDARLTAAGNYDSGGFMIGDIANGVSGVAGELLSTTFNRQNFGNDNNVIRNGAGTVLSSSSTTKFTSDAWYKISILWDTTPGSLTGNLTVTSQSWNGSAWVAHYSITTLSQFTFNSHVGYVAFGDIDSAGITFDNISITGKEITPAGTLFIIK